MSGPLIDMPEEIAAEMNHGTNKVSRSERTASTLATSISMLSMVTAFPEENLSIESVSADKDQAVGRGQPSSSSLRVRTLSDSLKSPDIFHSSERRSVAFDSVEIREYGIILGWYVMHYVTAYCLCTFLSRNERRPLTHDNPSLFLSIHSNPAVSAGVPTTIDWESLSSSMSSLEDYESGRIPRRSVLLLKTTKSEREKLLKESGYSSEELTIVENEVESIRKSRELSSLEKTDLQAMMAASRLKKAQQLKEKKRGGLLRKMFGRRR
jgi:hypothetical protein